MAKDKEYTISVTGLGYVGLPLALALAKKHRVIGYDADTQKVKLLTQHVDPSGEVHADKLQETSIEYASDAQDLKKATVHIVTVPTPVDVFNVPNLDPIRSATTSIAAVLKKGDIVVYESTVFPGCTEEECVPILEEISGLRLDRDFGLGYSPERVNPGDKKHTFEKNVKVVSASNKETLGVLVELYGQAVPAGIHVASSIKVAEASKVIENAQRDINIAFMNELAMIFDRMDINTQEVLAASRTKWNFLPFHPGLVGGHCIGVDPYYLAHKAEQLGYKPEVLLSGRRINDYLPQFIAKKLVKDLIATEKSLHTCKILQLGIAFKPDVTDTRNSKAIELMEELVSYGLHVDAMDYLAHENETKIEDGQKYDAIILAVPHQKYVDEGQEIINKYAGEKVVVYDLYAKWAKIIVPQEGRYWNL